MDKIMWSFIVAIIFLLGILIYAVYQDEIQWQEFRAQNNCYIVGKEKGGLSTGVGPNLNGKGGMSVVVISNPDKTGWLCDDGITYWR